MKNFTLSLVIIVTSACSTIEFNTSGRETFYIGARPASERLVEVETTKDFYFWGLSPKMTEFDLRDETEGEGVYNPSYVSIEQRYRLADIAWTVVTLGLYCPVTYRVTLLSNGELK